jgi:hypothetical protein
MTTYEIKKTIEGVKYLEATSEDGVISFIPLDPANSDYQAYLTDEATAK